MPSIHNTRITKLLRHLQAVEAGLRELSANKKAVPSPAEMQALDDIQHLLEILPSQAAACEAEFWERIETWRNTPDAPPVRLFRAAVRFIVAWMFGIFVFHAGGLWLVDKFLPLPTSFIISAGLSLIAVTLYFRSERKDDSKRSYDE